MFFGYIVCCTSTNQWLCIIIIRYYARWQHHCHRVKFVICLNYNVCITAVAASSWLHMILSETVCMKSHVALLTAVDRLFLADLATSFGQPLHSLSNATCHRSGRLSEVMLDVVRAATVCRLSSAMTLPADYGSPADCLLDHAPPWRRRDRYTTLYAVGRMFGSTPLAGPSGQFPHSIVVDLEQSGSSHQHFLFFLSIRPPPHIRLSWS